MTYYGYKTKHFSQLKIIKEKETSKFEFNLFHETERNESTLFNKKITF